MRQIAKTFFIFSIAALGALSGCSKEPEYRDLPRKVTILKTDGIPVFETYYDTKSPVALAQKGHTYDVLEGRASYYKVRLGPQREGWIEAGLSGLGSKAIEAPQDDGMGIFVIAPKGLEAHLHAANPNSKVVGFATANVIVPKVSAQYSHLMITLPGQKTGWIEVGKPKEKWVKFPEEKKAEEKK